MSNENFVFETTDLRKYFGGIKAVDGIDLQVKSNQIVGLIGPNGCGKSTTFNCITGILSPNSGSVKFFDTESSKLKPYEINKLGVSRTFQQTRLWRELTVIENLLVPPKNQPGASLWNLLTKPFQIKEREEELIDKAYETLEMLEIEHMANNFASELSGGQSKLVDIGRVLMSDPQIMLLDEPVAGVAGPLSEKIFEKIVEMRDKLNITFVMIEHDMEFILKKQVDNIFVMSQGKIIASGTPDEIKNQKEVQEAYLGY